MKRLFKGRTHGIAAPLLTIGLLVVPFTLFATPVQADDQYEWDPTSGYHEEEWYDPSDWFNEEDQQVEYEDMYNGDYYDGDVTAYDEYDEQDDYGSDYYTADWFDQEPDFDNWYDS